MSKLSSYAQLCLSSLVLTALLGCGSEKTSKPAVGSTGGATENTSVNESTNGRSVTVQPEKKEVKYLGSVQSIHPDRLSLKCSQTDYESAKNLQKQAEQLNSKLVSAAKIDSLKTVNDAQLAEASRIVAVCDSKIAKFKSQPCKFQKNILEEIVLDQAFLNRNCKLSEKYLNKFSSRSGSVAVPTPPAPPAPAPRPPVVPVAPVTPPVAPPVVQPVTQPVQGIRQCSDIEFQNINQLKTATSTAQSKINRLGQFENWKFDKEALTASTNAAKVCENFLVQFSEQTCQRQVKQNDGTVANKIYSQQSLREDCNLSRQYYYEFVQRTDSLNAKNADLYLDFSNFNRKVFPAASMENINENCVYENHTERDINYTNQPALIKSSRGFEVKQMTLETNEGLLISCYGLSLGAAFSKREIQQLLRQKSESGSTLNLFYKVK